MPSADMTRRLKQAEGIAATIAACGDAFDFIQRSAVAFAKPGSGLYHAFLSAVPVACDGRDQMWRAPSMPRSLPAPVIEPLDPSVTSPDAAADALTDLSAELFRTLSDAGRLHCEAADQSALLEASLMATEIIGILKGP